MLTTARAKSLSKLGMHGDGGTLYLSVKASGSKSWIQRVAIDGKGHDIGLGGFPIVSLAKARERAFANRVAIADGRNPLAEKIKAKIPTFREAAEKNHRSEPAALAQSKDGPELDWVKSGFCWINLSEVAPSGALLRGRPRPRIRCRALLGERPSVVARSR